MEDLPPTPPPPPPFSPLLHPSSSHLIGRISYQSKSKYTNKYKFYFEIKVNLFHLNIKFRFYNNIGKKVPRTEKNRGTLQRRLQSIFSRKFTPCSTKSLYYSQQKRKGYPIWSQFLHSSFF